MHYVLLPQINPFLFLVATIDSNSNNSICLWDLYSQSKVSTVSTSSLQAKEDEQKPETEETTNDVTSFIKGTKGRVLVGCKDGSLKVVAYSTDHKV